MFGDQPIAENVLQRKIGNALIRLGDLCLTEKDYKNSLRQYSHALMYIPNDQHIKNEIIKVNDLNINSMSESDIEEFHSIWKNPRSTISALYKQIKEKQETLIQLKQKT